jgi:cytochrome c-type biogenesis protein CcmF
VIVVGELSLWVGLLMATWATTVSFAGTALRRDDLISSGRRGLYATFVMLLLASVGLWTALLSRDFSLEYVAGHISATMPDAYVFSAFWSGQAGSFLLWALILSAFSSIAIAMNRIGNPELVPWATGTLGAMLVFFIAATCIKANPFTRLEWTPPDGRGMNPHLQHPGMAFHLATAYLAYVATAIPFAFAIAAVSSGRLAGEWLSAVRRWSFVSWFFLTIGIVLGMWCAYREPEWSRYWPWHPLQNASLFPWLTGTVFLHSSLPRDGRGMPRKWSFILVVATFVLAIAGTLQSQNAFLGNPDSFVQSPMGKWFGSFALIATGVAVYLVATRLRDARATRELERRQRYGGHIVHAGLIGLFAAFAGLGFKRDNALTLRAGEAAQLRDPLGHTWRFVSQGPSTSEFPDRMTLGVTLETWRDGQRIGFITSEKRQYIDATKRPLFEPFTVAGIRATPTLDVYVVLDTLRDEAADLRVSFNPLVIWGWIGGGVMVIGGLVGLWPGAERRST